MVSKKTISTRSFIVSSRLQSLLRKQIILTAKKMSGYFYKQLEIDGHKISDFAWKQLPGGILTQAEPVVNHNGSLALFVNDKSLGADSAQDIWILHSKGEMVGAISFSDHYHTPIWSPEGGYFCLHSYDEYQNLLYTPEAKLLGHIQTKDETYRPTISEDGKVLSLHTRDNKQKVYIFNEYGEQLLEPLLFPRPVGATHLIYDNKIFIQGGDHDLEDVWFSNGDPSLKDVWIVDLENGEKKYLQLDEPCGLQVSKHNRIYALGFNRHTLWVYNWQGEKLQEIDLPGECYAPYPDLFDDMVAFTRYDDYGNPPYSLYLYDRKEEKLSYKKEHVLPEAFSSALQVIVNKSKYVVFPSLYNGEEFGWIADKDGNFYR